MKAAFTWAKSGEPDAEPEPELSQPSFGRAAIRDSPDDVQLEPVSVGEFHVGDSNEDSDSNSESDSGATHGGNAPSALSVPLPELPTQEMQTDTESDSDCPPTPRLPDEPNVGIPPISVVGPSIPPESVLPAEQVSEIRALIEEAQADIAAGDYASGEAAIAHAEELERLVGKLRGRAPTIPTWSPVGASSMYGSSDQLLPTDQVDEIRALIIEAENDIAAGDYAGGEKAIAHAEQLEKMAGLLRGPPRQAHDQWHNDIQKHVESLHELHCERPIFGSSEVSPEERAVAKRRWQCSIEAHVEAIHALHVRRLLVKKRWRAAIGSHVEAIKQVRSSRGTTAEGLLVGHSSASTGADRGVDTRPEANPMLWIILAVILVIMIVQAVMVNSQLTEIQEHLQCSGNASVSTGPDAGTDG
eukprot:COSAG02_NODE_6163_length_3756_cov_8.168718_1_plen_415_part_00